MWGGAAALWQAAHVSAFCRAVDTVRPRQTAGAKRKKPPFRIGPDGGFVLKYRKAPRQSA